MLVPEADLYLVHMPNPTFQEKEAMVTLDRQIFGEGALSFWILSPLLKYGIVLALYKKQELIGLAEFLAHYAQHDCVYIYGFGVKPQHRGQGLGKWFLWQCMDFLKTKGYKTVELTVSPTNETALKLYQKVGFHKVEELLQEYGPGQDRWLMRVNL